MSPTIHIQASKKKLNRNVLDPDITDEERHEIYLEFK